MPDRARGVLILAIFVVLSVRCVLLLLNSQVHTGWDGARKSIA